MKKILSVILAGILMFSLAGCGRNETDRSRDSVAADGGNALVVYFSWSGNAVSDWLSRLGGAE